jgi:anti-anti-sigma regulatory factor
MSIPSIHRDGATLNIKIQGGFNLWIKNMILNHINNDTKVLKIDLSECKFIDSEGVIFLHQCQQDGKELQLINPPDVFFEILEILELDNSWQPNVINTNKE